MKRAALIGLVLMLGGCGGSHRTPRAPAPPAVAEQVREALLGALGSPALTGMTPAQQPQLPYTAVTSCRGPRAGGAGRYRCATTPRGDKGVRSVAVRVRRSGQWSSEPLTIAVTHRGHRIGARMAVWGVGIRFPGR